MLNNSAFTIRHERIVNAKKLDGLKVVIFSEAICNIHLQFSFAIKIFIWDQVFIQNQHSRLERYDLFCTRRS